MLWLPTIITLITTFCAIIIIIINFRILFNVFISKKLKRSSSLSLFYARFAVDGILGIINIFIMITVFFKLLHLEYLITSRPVPLFSIAWSSVITTAVRTLLSTIITLDRTFAVILPIFYHNSRTKCNNSIIIVMVLCWPILDNLILWVLCKYEVTVPSGCVTFACLSNKCFIYYSMGFELFSHSLIATLSLLLSIKLFYWNYCKKSGKSKDLERANFLALIDAFIIILFDILPAFSYPV
ncbi:hypothetical protein CAEBREN_15750 [Caenorhabditis brenneri]|uniref:G-protein coupled receptors family 1 profile domain-containing protein n=1 Tax=Caenorhabditis brenneri TaxID=135651 RepID=G0NEH0_CAEBE|nr:hypothetical protein CAEBREN_15750 [Caenorhabditis brenneri]